MQELKQTEVVVASVVKNDAILKQENELMQTL